MQPRVPQCSRPNDYNRWLAPRLIRHTCLADLLQVIPAETMTRWKISKSVGNVKNDNPSTITPN